MTTTTMDALATRRRITKSARARRPPTVPPAKPPAKPPTAVMQSMTRVLLDVVDAIEAVTLRVLADAGIIKRTDADSPVAPPTRAEIARVARELRKGLRTMPEMRSLGKRLHAIWEQAGRFNRREFQRQVTATMGIDLSAADPALRDLRSTFQRRNLDLITALSEEHVGRVETVLNNAGVGTRVERIRDDIVAATGATRSHAALIARDQVLKANAEMTQSRHEAAGITHYEWVTSDDERVRSGHKALDGKVFPYSEPPVVDTRTGRRGHPGTDYQCLPGEAPLFLGPRVVRAFRRLYHGELTTLVMDNGAVFHATPNHPILTHSGWKAAHLVDVGEDVFGTGHQCPDGLQDHVENRHATIQQVFDALTLVGVMGRVGGSASQFHGDGGHEEVHVVDAELGLPTNVDPARAQEVRELLLAVADADAECQLPGVGDCLQVLHALGFPPHRIVRGLGQALALRGWGARHASEHPRRPVPGLHTGPEKVPADRVPLDTELGGEGLLTLPGQVSLDDISDRDLLRIVGRAVWPLVDEPTSAESLAQRVRTAPEGSGDLGEVHPLLQHPLRVIEKGTSVFRGHVYNLQTVAGWYRTDITVRNCRCTASPQIPGFDTDED